MISDWMAQETKTEPLDRPACSKLESSQREPAQVKASHECVSFHTSCAEEALRDLESQVVRPRCPTSQVMKNDGVS